jgi:hypothetical protein
MMVRKLWDCSQPAPDLPSRGLRPPSHAPIGSLLHSARYSCWLNLLTDDETLGALVLVAALQLGSAAAGQEPTA